VANVYAKIQGNVVVNTYVADAPTDEDDIDITNLPSPPGPGATRVGKSMEFIPEPERSAKLPGGSKWVK
jgi:hypothetical protein